VAFGTIAPLGSVTVPTIEPKTACAKLREILVRGRKRVARRSATDALDFTRALEEREQVCGGPENKLCDMAIQMPPKKCDLRVLLAESRESTAIEEEAFTRW
jgi:hypothetical protein